MRRLIQYLRHGELLGEGNPFTVSHERDTDPRHALFIKLVLAVCVAALVFGQVFKPVGLLFDVLVFVIFPIRVMLLVSEDHRRGLWGEALNTSQASFNQLFWVRMIPLLLEAMLILVLWTFIGSHSSRLLTIIFPRLFYRGFSILDLMYAWICWLMLGSVFSLLAKSVIEGFGRMLAGGVLSFSWCYWILGLSVQWLRSSQSVGHNVTVYVLKVALLALPLVAAYELLCWFDRRRDPSRAWGLRRLLQEKFNLIGNRWWDEWVRSPGEHWRGPLVLWVIWATFGLAVLASFALAHQAAVLRQDMHGSPVVVIAEMHVFLLALAGGWCLPVIYSCGKVMKSILRRMRDLRETGETTADALKELYWGSVCPRLAEFALACLLIGVVQIMAQLPPLELNDYYNGTLNVELMLLQSLNLMVLGSGMILMSSAVAIYSKTFKQAVSGSILWCVALLAVLVVLWFGFAELGVNLLLMSSRNPVYRISHTSVILQFICGLGLSWYLALSLGPWYFGLRARIRGGQSEQ